MARYEEARAMYQKAVLSTMVGKSRGEAIRRAIVEFRVAQRELGRLRSRVPPPLPRPAAESAEEESSFLPGLSFFRRLLSAS